VGWQTSVRDGHNIHRQQFSLLRGELRIRRLRSPPLRNSAWLLMTEGAVRSDAAHDKTLFSRVLRCYYKVTQLGSYGPLSRLRVLRFVPDRNAHSLLACLCRATVFLAPSGGYGSS